MGETKSRVAGSWPLTRHCASCWPGLFVWRRELARCARVPGWCSAPSARCVCDDGGVAAGDAYATGAPAFTGCAPRSAGSRPGARRGAQPRRVAGGVSASAVAAPARHRGVVRLRRTCGRDVSWQQCHDPWVVTGYSRYSLVQPWWLPISVWQQLDTTTGGGERGRGV
jgi:hypothetical protein